MADVAPGAVQEWIDRGRMVRWEADGAAVAMASLTRAVARVGPVYTPPGKHRRGNAGAVTVAVSQLALDRGVEQVVLFTNLANPTSNALYQRIGYRPVEDRLVLSFESTASSA
jgi:predicted GNAT family acetyltransferase